MLKRFGNQKKVFRGTWTVGDFEKGKIDSKGNKGRCIYDFGFFDKTFSFTT